MKKCCETCENLIAIGEGDHICLEVAAKDGDPATVQNVVEMEMKYSFPDCHETRRLQDIVCEYKSRYSGK